MGVDTGLKKTKTKTATGSLPLTHTHSHSQTHLSDNRLTSSISSIHKYTVFSLSENTHPYLVRSWQNLAVDEKQQGAQVNYEIFHEKTIL